MSDTNQEDLANFESLWDIDGLPEEYNLFTTEAARAAAQIVNKNPLLQGALEENEHPLDALFLIQAFELAAQAGARVAVAALVEADLVQHDAPARVRTEHKDPDGSPFFSVSQEMFNIVRGIEERTNQPISKEGQGE